MTDHEASRTLVKSLPELWAECSDAASLARHLSPSFGEIKITRLEPETTVAWEGERASGTVRIEPSAWGTRVTLTAQTEGDEVAAAVEPEPPVPEPPPTPEPPSEAGNEVRDETDAVEETTQPASEGDSGPTVVNAPPPASPPRGLIARLRMRWRPAGASLAVGSVPPPAVAVPEPEPVAVEPEPELEPGPVAIEAEPPPELPAEAESRLDAAAVLAAALDSLGQAHHRPYSRA